MTDEISKVDKNGNKYWYNECYEYHRLNNLPAIIWCNGEKEYYVDGKYHRTNGSAVTDFDYKAYWINGIFNGFSEQYALWICNKVEIL